VNIFETLREQVPLVWLVEPGSGGKAHCVAPEHRDDNPSMHIYNDHVHCFACGFHGDVTDVWAAMRGFDKPLEAGPGSGWRVRHRVATGKPRGVSEGPRAPG
jgi:DNA primase